MIRFTEKADKKTGGVVRQYLLKRGDSFRFKATSADNGDLVSAVKFKVSDEDYCQFYVKDYELNEDGSWYLFVESADTTGWKVTEGYDYITEVEVTYSDGGVDTVENGVLKVVEEIHECGNE